MKGKDPTQAKTGNVLSIAIVLIVTVSAGVAIHALIQRLSDQVIWSLVGGLGVLLVVGIVAVLFIIKDLAQAYVMRKMMADDDLQDLRQMAMMSSIMRGGNRTPNVNLRLPPGQQMGNINPWQVVGDHQPHQPYPIDGSYRDTIPEEVEIE
jgi:hypothetical protein